MREPLRSIGAAGSMQIQIGSEFRDSRLQILIPLQWFSSCTWAKPLQLNGFSLGKSHLPHPGNVTYSLENRSKTAASPVSHNRAVPAGSSRQTNLEVLLQLTVAELAIVVWQQTCIRTARGAAMVRCESLPAQKVFIAIKPFSFLSKRLSSGVHSAQLPILQLRQRPQERNVPECV